MSAQDDDIYLTLLPHFKANIHLRARRARDLLFFYYSLGINPNVLMRSSESWLGILLECSSAYDQVAFTVLTVLKIISFLL